MQEVISYLTLKNEFYERFYLLTKKFLLQIQKNKWEGIELFIDNRERILNIIKTFDYKISNCTEKDQVSNAKLEAYKPKVKALLSERESWIKKIVALDLEIIPLIEEMKSETIQELKRKIELDNQMSNFILDKPAAKIRGEV